MSQSNGVQQNTPEILLVEDNPGDVRLVREGLRGSAIAAHLNVVSDGVEALAFLRREGQYAEAPRPDLMILDLNLPKKDGREVLAAVKTDPQLKRIPVVVLTTSRAKQDVLQTYDLHVNSYVAKPLDLDEFIGVIRSIVEYWLTVAVLPQE